MGCPGTSGLLGLLRLRHVRRGRPLTLGWGRYAAQAMPIELAPETTAVSQDDSSSDAANDSAEVPSRNGEPITMAYVLAETPEDAAFASRHRRAVEIRRLVAAAGPLRRRGRPSIVRAAGVSVELKTAEVGMSGGRVVFRFVRDEAQSRPGAPRPGRAEVVVRDSAGREYESGCLLTGRLGLSGEFEVLFAPGPSPYATHMLISVVRFTAPSTPLPPGVGQPFAELIEGPWDFVVQLL